MGKISGKDAIKLIAVFLITLGIPALICGLMTWFWFWVAIASVLTIFEFSSKALTGKTMSKKWWVWKDKPTTKKRNVVMFIVGMVVFWTYLILHLLFEI